MTAMQATAALRALPRMIASDDMVVAAMDDFAQRAQQLTRSELVTAAYIAATLMQRARPEWSELECQRSIACVLHERERGPERRRAAA